MNLHSIGIDLGKAVFHLLGLSQSREVVGARSSLVLIFFVFTAKLQVDLIGMEACAGSHFLGRALREQGHEVRVIPAQYVKPFVKTNKNDFIDAEAIAEAVCRPSMRFVPIDTDSYGVDYHGTFGSADRGEGATLSSVRWIIPP